MDGFGRQVIAEFRVFLEDLAHPVHEASRFRIDDTQCSHGRDERLSERFARDVILAVWNEKRQILREMNSCDSLA